MKKHFSSDVGLLRRSLCSVAALRPHLINRNLCRAIAVLTILNGALPAFAEDIRFPADANVLNVKNAPYNAVGNGVANDTAAIQAAMNDARGQLRTVYLPNGTYRLTDKVSLGNSIYSAKHVIIQGQSQAGTIIKLDNGCPGYGDPNSPKPVVSFADSPIYTGQAFTNSIYNVTIDVGANNPGATALQYIANNQGIVENVTLKSSDANKRGRAGLDLRPEWPGPFLVKNLTVDGFDYGVWCPYPWDYAIWFEDLTLRDQKILGVNLADVSAGFRRVTSTNSVPAMSLGNGFGLVVDGTFNGGSASQPAIVSGGFFFLRNLSASGYGRLMDAWGSPYITGLSCVEQSSHGVTSLFSSSPQTSLGLPVEETPALVWDDPSLWVKPNGTDGAAIQAAIDSAAAANKSTVYLPWQAEFGPSPWRINSTIRIHGSVRRVLCMSNLIAIDEPLRSSSNPLFRVESPDSATVSIERIGWMTGGGSFNFVEHNSNCTLLLKNLAISGVAYKTAPGKAGKVFVEDVAGKGWLFGNGQKAWCRQINPENDLTQIDNNGADVWLFGAKHEQINTMVTTRNAGRTELLGGVLHNSSGISNYPGVVVQDATFTGVWMMATSSADRIYNYQAEVTRAGSTLRLNTSDTPRRGNNAYVTLFVERPTSGGGTVATPTMSPAGGSYTSAQSVTISTTTSGAGIRYTTDGSTPTATSGTVYSGAINISATSTLKAIATKSGMTDSAVVTAAYTITGGGTVATPTMSPAGGSYTSAQLVTISTTTSGAAIRYTTDGSTPTATSGTVYSGAVNISATSTLKAIATKSGMSDSAVATAVYTISTGGGSTVLPRTGWTASASNNSAASGNALDGDFSSRWATGALQVNGQWFQLDLGAAQTFNRLVLDASSSPDDYPRGYAVYVSDDGSSWGSPIASGTGNTSVLDISFSSQTKRYVRIVQTGSSSTYWSIHELNLYTSGGGGGGTVATPTMSPAGGSYTSAQSVTISTSTSGAGIRYTTDGSTPTATSGTVYSGAVNISATTTLKAVATKSGMTDSAVATAAYTISGGTVAMPTMNPAAGSYASAQSVTISTSTSGASIRYTTDGSTPTATSGTVYSGAINISATTTLKAIATKSGMTDSTVATAAYTITTGGGSTALSRTGWIATASNNSSSAGNALDGNASSRWDTGALQTNGQWFQLDLGSARTFDRLVLDTTGSPNDYPRGYAVYVSDDGSSWGSPIASGTGSSAVLDISFSSQTKRYVAIEQTGSGPWYWSIHELNLYTSGGGGGGGTVATPTMSPAGGNYTTAQSVTISTTTSGAGIRYTTDGSTPTATSGTAYSGAVNISATTTLKAIATKSGMTDSAVATAVYTISTGGGSTMLPRTGWSASASNNSAASGNAIDGDLSSRWATGALQVNGQWFQLDLGAAQTFNRLVLDASSSPDDYPRGYAVYVSDDGSSWGSPIASGTGNTSVLDISFNSQTKRYVRIVQTGSSSTYWSIHELNLYNSGGGTVATPTMSPAGGSYTTAQSVTISTTTSGAGIRYTTDGSTPTATSGTVYSGAVNITATTTLKAIATKSGMTDSTVATATYTISGGTVAMPTMNPAAGSYASAQSVTISTTTSGASIRYTTDGSTPTASSGTVYSGAVNISATTTLKAIATKSGMTDSAVATAAYTITTGGGSTALSRTGWIATASNNGGSAGNALDGNASSRWDTGALQTNGQWFQLDLGAARTFDRLVLDTTGSPNDYPRGYAVYVSDDGSSWGSPIASGTGSSAVLDISFSSQTKRYVRIVQTGSGSWYWSIHELNLYTSGSAILLYEGFAYPAGSNIASQNGGTGWAAGSSWAASGTAVATASLTFSDYPATGAAAQITTGDKYISRTIGFTQPGTGTFWTSYLFKDVSWNDYLDADVLGFSDAQGEKFLSAAGEIGMYAAVAVDDTYGPAGSVKLCDGNTYLIVSKFTRVGAGTSANPQTATMWVLSPGQYDAIKAGGITEAELDANHTVKVSDSYPNVKALTAGDLLWFYNGRSGKGFIDEIKVGDSINALFP